MIDLVDEQFVIEAVERVAATDASTADSATCAAVLADLRRTRGWLDAVEARFIADRTLTITRPDGEVHATTRPDIATERQRRRRQPAA